MDNIIISDTYEEQYIMIKFLGCLKEGKDYPYVSI